jgi:hypothetical protein
MVASLVVFLFVIIRPLAIFWGVVTVVVFPLQKEAALERRHHVIEEIHKIIPPFTDANSSPAIPLIFSISGIITPSSHVYPSAV